MSNKANFLSLHSGNQLNSTRLRTVRLISTIEHKDAMNVKQVTDAENKEFSLPKNYVIRK